MRKSPQPVTKSPLQQGDIDVNLPAPRPSAPRATIRDVAALAGVGIKTVSRVINDEANVSPQMRERVESAVAV